MAQGTLWFQPIQHFFIAGTVVPGAKAYFYLAGSVTPVNVFSDVGLTTAITQPVVADANGVFVEIFLTPGTAYKVDVQTSAGVSLTGYPADNQLAVPASTVFVAFNGTAGETLTANLSVYLSDGSGGKNAGQWYKADSTNTYSSTLPEVGFVPAAIASGAVGLIQQVGQLSGFTALTIGADYFLSTAGAITLTPPTNGNVRFIGRADSTISLIIGANQAAKGQTLVSPIVTTSLITPASAGLFYGCCGGRLTLTTGLAVTTADVTGATNVFFTPYAASPFCGNIGLYDGTTNWTVLPFTELTLALGTVTSALPYDVFAFNNAGVVALEKVAWASAAAIFSSGTYQVTRPVQNGIYVKSTNGTVVDATRRYLGTFYTTSTTQTEDSFAQRLLYNYYNRVPRGMWKGNTGNYAYTTATWRESAGGTTNELHFVIGVSEQAVALHALSLASNATSNINCGCAIGLDVTTTPTPANQEVGFVAVAAAMSLSIPSRADVFPAVGYHYAARLEYSVAGGTTTWYENANVAGQQAGIGGTIWA